jgi:hypothetical protein
VILFEEVGRSAKSHCDDLKGVACVGKPQQDIRSCSLLENEVAAKIRRRKMYGANSGRFINEATRVGCESVVIDELLNCERESIPPLLVWICWSAESADSPPVGRAQISEILE